MSNGPMSTTKSIAESWCVNQSSASGTQQTLGIVWNPSPITPNGATWLMIAAGLAAAAMLSLPGLPAAVAAALLIQLQILLDCSDGEVARWRQRFSPAGIYLDRVGHYLTEAALPIALGLRADGYSLSSPPSPFPLAPPRAATHAIPSRQRPISIPVVSRSSAASGVYSSRPARPSCRASPPTSRSMPLASTSSPAASTFTPTCSPQGGSNC